MNILNDVIMICSYIYIFLYLCTTNIIGSFLNAWKLSQRRSRKYTWNFFQKKYSIRVKWFFFAKVITRHDIWFETGPKIQMENIVYKGIKLQIPFPPSRYPSLVFPKTFPDVRNSEKFYRGKSLRKNFFDNCPDIPLVFSKIDDKEGHLECYPLIQKKGFVVLVLLLHP